MKQARTRSPFVFTRNVILLNLIVVLVTAVSLWNRSLIVLDLTTGRRDHGATSGSHPESITKYSHHLLPSGDVSEPYDPRALPTGLWMHATTGGRGGGGRMLIGTTFTQNYMWRHQHPPNCRNPDLKAMVFNTAAVGNGIGSLVHVYGVALAVSRHSDHQGRTRERLCTYYAV